MESGEDESGESVMGVSGWDGGWTGSKDCSGTEDSVGDADCVLGIGALLVDAITTSLATDGTGSGINSLFMGGKSTSLV